MSQIKDITIFSDEELETELQRRKLENKKKLMMNDYKKRMNTTIKKCYSKETENEIFEILMINPKYENNIQKALTWGIKTKSISLVESVIGIYKELSEQKYLNYIPYGIELEDILFTFEIDTVTAKRYLDKVLSYWVENELLLLRLKRHGGVDLIYHEWRTIETEYDKEIHRTNRKKINDALEHAKDSSRFSRYFRRSIINMLRSIQSLRFLDSQHGDFLEALNFLRWQDARWKTCGEDV